MSRVGAAPALFSSCRPHTPSGSAQRWPGRPTGRRWVRPLRPGGRIELHPVDKGSLSLFWFVNNIVCERVTIATVVEPKTKQHLIV